MRFRRRYSPPGVWIVGLDLSLNRPAACILSPTGWAPGRWVAGVRMEAWPGDPPMFEGKDADKVEREAERRLRCARIAHHVTAFVGRTVPRDPDYVRIYVEDYAFSKHSAAVTRLAELRGVVRQMLHERLDFDLRIVTASECRKLLLGKNPKSDPKLYVQGALWRGGAPVADRLLKRAGVKTGFRGQTDRQWDEDECDAFAVANFGRADSGLTALSLA